MIGVASSTAPRVQVVARTADVRLQLSRAVEATGLLASETESSAGPRIDVVVTRQLDDQLIASLPPRAGVVVVGGDPMQAAAVLSSSARPFGIVSGDAGPDALKAAILAVAAGFRVVPSALRPIRLTPEKVTGDDSDVLLDEPLTPREHEVLELAAQGLSNHAIGARLGISDHTVKFHLASVYGKLGARSRTAAVRRGLARGLISI